MRQSRVRRVRVGAVTAVAAGTVAAVTIAGVLVAGVIVGVGVSAAGPAQPAAAAPAPAGGTSMVVNGSDPLKPTLVLTNNGTAPCQIAATSLGTLGITDVVQSGTASAPIATDPSFPDGVDVYLAGQLKTLAPGASVTIDLPVLPVGPTGHALESVTWSEQASMGVIYPVKAGVPVQITATYAVPVRPASGPPLCAVAANGGVASGASSSSGTDNTLLVVAGIVLAVLLVAALLALLILRRRRHMPPRATAPPGTPGQPVSGQPVSGQAVPGEAASGQPVAGQTATGRATSAPRARGRATPAAGGVAEPEASGSGSGASGGPAVPPVLGAVLVLVAAVAAIGVLARPAFATITVDPSLSGAYAQCAPLFGMAGGDPAGLFPILNDPSKTVTIIPAGGDQTHEISVAGQIIIFWNVNDHHAYTGGGNAEPCSALYHEMYHGKEDLTGGQDHSQCVTAAGPSGLPVNEVNATKAENVLRVKEGLPPRTTYGDTPLPAGDCLPKDKQPQPKGNCTGPGCGDTNGDPHLVTFDGQRYDFQGAGEFVAARDTTSDNLQIQVRQQPIVGSQTVAVNTAIAMAVGGDKVEVDSDLGALALVVNGVPAPVAAASLPHGGTITYDDVTIRPTLEVHWPDGSLAIVTAIGMWGLHLTAQPSAAHAGKMVGLLGNFDGDKTNDIRTATGKTLAVQPAFGDLYPGYADSWRITDATSLFTYQNGAHTATYTDRSFPHQQALAQGLPNEVGARALCGRLSIVDIVTLANCVLDVAETGQAEFALAALDTQTMIEQAAASPGTPSPAPSGPPVVTSTPTVGPTATQTLGGTEATLTVDKVGGTDRLTFHATAGQRLYIDVLSSSFVAGCGDYLIIGPSGGTVDIGCLNQTGAGDLGGDLLPDTGTYALELRPDNGQTGSMHVRLTFSTDVLGTLTPDGAPTVATIALPGQVGLYTFAGTAGERVYVDASGATLPAACGTIALRSPENGTIDLGCLDDNGAGYIDGNLLTSTGQYTVVVDPADAVLGRVSLRLITSHDIHGATSVGGVPVTATIATPGQIAFYSFAGTKGQKIKVTVTGTTLPGACGIPVLLGPSGDAFDEGCLLSGAMTDTLNETGTWKIEIDLPTTMTGSVTFVVQPG